MGTSAHIGKSTTVAIGTSSSSGPVCYNCMNRVIWLLNALALRKNLTVDVEDDIDSDEYNIFVEDGAVLRTLIGPMLS